MTQDVLSDVLTSMRVKGTVYFCDHVIAPWRKEFLDTTTAAFHQIRKGTCWLHTENGTEYLENGDVIFLRPGLDHVLTSDDPKRQNTTGVPETLLLCGYFEFNQSWTGPQRAVFPRFRIIRARKTQASSWMRVILDQLAAEYLSARPGAQLAIDRLTEVLVVELIRASFDGQEKTGYLEAISDRYVGQALQRLHADPANGWTLESLAREIGISRAGLARRFKDRVGQPMFGYLTDLRMQNARELLKDSELSLHAVAHRVGYRSTIAFAKTFKKLTGETPSAYRKR